MAVFKLRLQSVLKTLEYFAELAGRNGKERAEARGPLLQLRSFKVCFVLHLLDLVLPVANCTSKYMQGKSADIATTTDLVSSTIATMEAMRNDDMYSTVYSDAVRLSASLGIDAYFERLARVRNPPAFLQNSVVM